MIAQVFAIHMGGFFWLISGFINAKFRVAVELEHKRQNMLENKGFCRKRDSFWFSFWPILPNKKPGFLVLLGSIILALFVFFSFNFANAGFFSFLEKLTGKSSAESTASLHNFQNLPLLSAPNAPETLGSVGGFSAFYPDGVSLAAAVGPLGSVAEADLYKLDQITTYIVREGDNLSEIAEMFGINLKTLFWTNDIKSSNLIRPGDVLVILPISGVQYEVKEGDTAEKIAEKYKADAEEILEFNRITEGLKAGVTIIIPNAELSPIPSPTYSTLRGSGGPNLAGYFARPIAGGRKSQGLHGFNGVDLADSCGNPVFASASGEVIVARGYGWNGGYGQYVVLTHPNGTQTVYAHLSGVFVSVGQYLSQGTHLGNIGSTGHSTGCHVHFEVRGAGNPF